MSVALYSKRFEEKTTYQYKTYRENQIYSKFIKIEIIPLLFRYDSDSVMVWGAFSFAGKYEL